MKEIPEHWIHKHEIDHVDEEHGEDPDDDPDHNLDGHHGPRLVLAVAPGAEPVLDTGNSIIRILPDIVLP